MVQLSKRKLRNMEVKLDGGQNMAVPHKSSPIPDFFLKCGLLKKRASPTKVKSMITKKLLMNFYIDSVKRQQTEWKVDQGFFSHHTDTTVDWNLENPFSRVAQFFLSFREPTPRRGKIKRKNAVNNS